MSEGSKLAFRIEFEADEESLSRSVEEAVRNAQPKIQEILQGMLEDIGIPEGARASEAVIPPEFFTEIRMIGEQVQNAMRAWDITSFQAVSTQRTQSKTIQDLLHQSAVMVEKTREAGGEVGPMVSSIIASAIAGVIDAISKNPAQAQQILGSEIGSITKRESIWGELASSVRALSETLKLSEGYERGLSDIEELRAVRDLLASSVSHERLKDIATSMMREEDPEAFIRNEITMHDMLGLLGVSREEAVGVFRDIAVQDPTMTDEKIQAAVDAWDKIRFDILSVGQEGVTIGEVKPIVRRQEAREVPGRNLENQMIQAFLESDEHMTTFVEKIAEISKKTGEPAPSSVEPRVGGEMFAFGATAGSAETIMGHGWKYREMRDPTVEVMQWQMATMVEGLEEQVRDMVMQGDISERIGEYLLASLSSKEITDKIDELVDAGRETLSVRDDTTSSEAARIPESVEALMRQNKDLLKELVRFAEMLVERRPEEAAKLEGLIERGRDLSLGDGL